MTDKSHNPYSSFYAGQWFELRQGVQLKIRIWPPNSAIAKKIIKSIEDDTLGNYLMSDEYHKLIFNYCVSDWTGIQADNEFLPCNIMANSEVSGRN